MESNWRMGVWDLGLTDSEVLLIARYGMIGSFNAYICKIKWVGHYAVYLGVPPMEVPIPSVYFNIDPAFPNYPYGFPADPDH